MGVPVLLIWGCDDNGGIALFSKPLTLPVLPHKGDVFTVDDTYPIDVESVEFIVKGTATEVQIILKSWSRFRGQPWEDVFATFLAKGWMVHYTDGDASEVGKLFTPPHPPAPSTSSEPSPA